jgi:hypothetical protein
VGLCWKERSEEMNDEEKIQNDPSYEIAKLCASMPALISHGYC